MRAMHAWGSAMHCRSQVAGGCHVTHDANTKVGVLTGATSLRIESSPWAHPPSDVQDAVVSPGAQIVRVYCPHRGKK